jgi:hypothetical protein
MTRFWACHLRVDLTTNGLSAGVLTRGVARKRREPGNPKSGVPTSVFHHRDKEQFQMTITIGIDPHKASHTAVAIDNTECVLDELRVRACSKQTDQLQSWRHRSRIWCGQ